MAKFSFKKGQKVRTPEGHNGIVVSRTYVKGAERYTVKDELGHILPYLKSELKSN
jgi:hypothetical protein